MFNYGMEGLSTDYYKDVRRKWKQAEKSDLPCEHVLKRLQHLHFRLDSPANQLQSNRKGSLSLLLGEHAQCQFTDPIDSLQLKFL